MRITAPTFLTPLTRPFGVGGELRVGVSVVSGWTLSGAPLAAQEVWTRFAKAAGPDALLDQGLPKSASEYVLVGAAHSEQPVEHLAVSIEVGSHRKVLNVVGDRVWTDGVPSRPVPFTTMPLDWRRAFGGAGYAENPLGRGYCTGLAEGVPLPNVELPGHMVGSPRDRPPPASFGALGIDWPQRTRGLGTYDAAWFEHDFPGFARDIDWRVHNVAPEDQRFDEPLAPGLRVVLHHLVQGAARVEVVLPRVAARCFTYRDDAASALEEVGLAPRTLWLVPDEDMLVLVFHGSLRVGSMLASELRGLLVALDDSDRPRTVEHFARALHARLDRERGALEMLDERPLMPEGMTFPDFAGRAEDFTLPEAAGALEANLARGAELRRQEALRLFAAAGFEGGEALFPPQRLAEPSPEPLAAQVREALETSERERERAEAMVARMREDAERELRALGMDPSILRRPVGGPPVLPSAQLAAAQELIRSASEASAEADFDALTRELEDPAFLREVRERDAAAREGYRISAHVTDVAPDMDLDRMAVVRATVEAAIRDRASLAEADLTGADLAELDLSGMDLRGAWLEGANLASANLTGARLDGAVLAKANLGEAVFHQTCLARANLGKARLVWTSMEACDLEEAILASADLRGASLSRSSLRGADLGGVQLEQTSFSECDLEGVTLLEAALGDTVFRGSTLAECAFVNVDLGSAVFERCRMNKAAFVGCFGAGVVFADAVLENARFVAGCRLEGADFRRADLRRATLRGAALAGARFDEARLADSDLSQATLERAVFYRAELQRVLATEADLREAVLTGANLMNAVLQGADLRGADLRGANLFAADLAWVHADTGTRLEGALVTRVRHRPLRRPQGKEAT